MIKCSCDNLFFVIKDQFLCQQLRIRKKYGIMRLVSNYCWGKTVRT
jgi:hypothetical protein